MIDYTLLANFLMGMLLGVGMGLLIAAHVHKCPPTPTLAVQESTAVETYKRDLRMLAYSPHKHLFTDIPIRSEHGWQTWDCQVCGQEYSSRQQRIKPEARIV